MTFYRQFKIGISSYFKAFNFLVKHNLMHYFIAPLLVNILLFIVGLTFINMLTAWFEGILSNQMELMINDIEWLESFKNVLSVFLWLVFKIIYLVIFAFFGGFIVLIFLSPVLATLSEKTEEIVTGITYKFSWKKLISDIMRGVFIASRNLFFELIFVILFFFIGLIPVVNLFVPFALYLVSSYYYGFSFMDYANERRQRSISEGIRFIRKNKGTAIANGLVFSLLLMLPFVGLLLASFMSIVAVVAATIATIEIETISQDLLQEPLQKP